MKVEESRNTFVLNVEVRAASEGLSRSVFITVDLSKSKLHLILLRATIFAKFTTSFAYFATEILSSDYAAFIKLPEFPKS